MTVAAGIQSRAKAAATKLGLSELLFPDLFEIASPPTVPGEEIKSNIVCIAGKPTVQTTGLDERMLPPERWQTVPDLVRAEPPATMSAWYNKTLQSGLAELLMLKSSWPTEVKTYTRAQTLADPAVLALWKMTAALEKIAIVVVERGLTFFRDSTPFIPLSETTMKKLKEEAEKRKVLKKLAEAKGQRGPGAAPAAAAAGGMGRGRTQAGPGKAPEAGKKAFEGICDYCEKKGHKMADCWAYGDDSKNGKLHACNQGKFKGRVPPNKFD